MTGINFSPVGGVEPFQGQLIKTLIKKSATVLTRGDVCTQDTSVTPAVWKQAGVGAKKPFAIASEGKGAGSTSFAGIRRGLVAVTTADGLEPGDKVVCAASGQVKNKGVGTDPDLEVGVYIGHWGETSDGNNPPTSAVANDVVVISKEEY